MGNRESERYYLAPPDVTDFHALFSYFWSHGIGRPVKNGVQAPWNKFDLEESFLSRNKNIDIRTIENWKSGRSVPHVKNLIVLSNIASAGDKYRQKIWSEAFIRAYDENKKASTLGSKIDLPYREKPEVKKAPVFKTSLLALCGLALISALGLGLSTQKTSTKPVSSKVVSVAKFANNTGNPDLDYLASGLATLFVDALFQIDDIKAIRSNGLNSNSNISAEVQCTIFGVSGAYENVCQIVTFPDQAVVWSKRFEFAASGDIHEMQRTIPLAAAEVMSLVVSNEALDRMKLMGTKNLDGFISYQKGRESLKHWHSDRTEKGMSIAFESLINAARIDNDWSEPGFHLVDIYLHYISGDTKVLDPLTLNDAALEVPKLLSTASDNAINDEEKFKAAMNSIFFSEDWTGLVTESEKYVKAAVLRRGELEWLYEPIILLILGDYELTESLLSNRLIKFDLENGTGHAYRIRNMLLSNEHDRASALIDNISVTKFQNRIDEVKGFTAFRMKDQKKLEGLLTSENNLSALYKDYFSILDFALKGKKIEGLEVIESSEALESSKTYLALAYLHLGDRRKGRDLLEKVSGKPLGDVDISTAIAYGAGCGLNAEDFPKKLLTKFDQAKISLPKCIH